MPFVVVTQVVEEAVLDQGSMPSTGIHQRTAFEDGRRIHSWSSSADVGSSWAVVEGTMADAHSQPCRMVEEVSTTMVLVLKALSLMRLFAAESQIGEESRFFCSRRKYLTFLHRTRSKA